jgi:hypothetical protein
VDGEVQVHIDEEKLSKEALWDGLHGIFTNIKEKDMPVEEILTQYHGLWQVEESFRINKHDLKMRPILSVIWFVLSVIANFGLTLGLTLMRKTPIFPHN